LKELKVEIGKRRDLCESFKDFMHHVVQSSQDEFSNVQDLIARFNDLKLIREEASQKTTKSLTEGVTAQDLQNKALNVSSCKY